MSYEIRDCIDAGTEYCPCHLAETGDCILCSQLSGSTFCDCINWKGVCIYQEYKWNKSRAKEGRKNYTCEIISKETFDKKVIIFTIRAPHELIKNLTHPGSYVFMRNPRYNQFYDTPISIMDANVEENWFKVAIEIKGVKTKALDLLNGSEKIIIRGPFWNGVLGLRGIFKSKEGTAILVARGIGQAPMVPILKKLYSNGNKIIVIMDKTPYKEILVKRYLEMCDAEVIECRTIEFGELSKEFTGILNDLLEKRDINILHSDGPDILNYKIIEFIDNKVDFSCCNNAKMCCGEGVCGSCSMRYKNHRIKKVCKLQTEPKNIFEGRRSL